MMQYQERKVISVNNFVCVWDDHLTQMAIVHFLNSVGVDVNSCHDESLFLFQSNFDRIIFIRLWSIYCQDRYVCRRAVCHIDADATFVHGDMLRSTLNYADSCTELRGRKEARDNQWSEEKLRVRLHKDIKTCKLDGMRTWPELYLMKVRNRPERLGKILIWSCDWIVRIMHQYSSIILSLHESLAGVSRPLRTLTRVTLRLRALFSGFFSSNAKSCSDTQ